MIEWNYLHGRPAVSAEIKQHPADFIVDENLGFTFDGEGEHVLVHIRKTGCNTNFVADKLADFAGISRREVSYAGQKDRHAVTTQWFCLRMPGKEAPDFSQFQLDGVEVLTVTRHTKKLRIGALKGNTFCLTLRNISDPAELEKRLNIIRAQGVPNYFGLQRFGRNGDNLTQAKKWAKDEITVKSREKRSFYLSAVRSAMFNDIVSARISAGLFDEILPGDAMQLDGSGSWFIAQPEEFPALKARLADFDIHISAPLVGDDAWGSEQDALAFETHIVAPNTEFLSLVKQARMNSARRAIRVKPTAISDRWLDASTLELSFALPAGCFATSVLRELVAETSSMADLAE